MQVEETIDYHDKCEKGGKCNNNGDTFYTINGKQYRESGFKTLRRFSPKFRQHKIHEWIRENELNLTMESVSCSKCGHPAIGRFF